jgi:hypothetical protein
MQLHCSGIHVSFIEGDTGEGRIGMWVEERVDIPDWRGVKVREGGDAIGTCDDSIAEVGRPERILIRESDMLPSKERLR